MFEKLRILSIDIDHLSFAQSIEQVMEWGLNHISSFVCFVNVHMLIEAHTDPSFRHKLMQASLAVADGKPVATACHLLYKKRQERISGMDFMPGILEIANEKKATIFLYGSTPEILKALQKKIAINYPYVKIGGAISPPFVSKMNEEELQHHFNEINESGANIVFIALGCPKQEKWMADNYTRVNAVLLGVGGAFPVMAGLQPRSPKWMQKWSLEWLYRLIQEPKRMFRRYFYTNLYFIFLFTKELLTRKTK